MAEIYANNVSGKLAEPITSSDTNIPLQPGHNFPDPGSSWYRATLYRWEFTSEGIREFDHETVNVTALTSNTLTVVRALEGKAQTFESGTRIELRMTAGTATDLEARAKQGITDHVDDEDPHAQYELKTKLKAAAYRDVVGGIGPLMAEGAYGLGTDTLPQIGSFSNFDDYEVTGFYGVYSSSTAETITNIPVKTAGVLFVISAPGSAAAQQIYFSSNRQRYYIRSKFGTWSNWRELYHSENIIGTVTHEGGVPTGAIIERGSNSDGSYTVFAGGCFLAQRVVPAIAVNNTEVIYSLPVEAEVGSVSMSLSCRVNLNTTARRNTVRDHIVGGATSWSLALLQSSEYIPAGNIDLALFAYGQRK